VAHKLLQNSLLNLAATRAQVAYDIFDIDPADTSQRAFPCRSAPLCIKVKIEGTRPRFIAPTPLEDNSFDDNGLLVPGRTDVPVRACLRVSPHFLEKKCMH
jgi:hypothetical protein